MRRRLCTNSRIMSLANGDLCASTLRLLLPLLTLPFLLAQENSLTNLTAVQWGNTSMEKATKWPTLPPIEQRATGGLEIQSQGPEGNATSATPAPTQRLEVVTTGSPELETVAEGFSEATTPSPTTTTITAITFTTAFTTAITAGLAAATAASSAALPHADPPLTTTAATASGIVTSDASARPPTPTTSTTTSSSFTTPSSSSTSTSTSTTSQPESSSVSSVTHPGQRPPDPTAKISTPKATATPTPTATSASVITPVLNSQEPSGLWLAVVVLLALMVCVGAVACLGMGVKRWRRRRQVLHLRNHGYSYRNNKGKEGDAWAGPVTIGGGGAAAAAREECEGEANGGGAEEEEKRKSGGGDEVLLSTFGVERTGRPSPEGRGGVGRLGSTEASRWEEESPLLYIDEDQGEAERKPDANNLEGGGGGEVGKGGGGEKVTGELKEKEKEKDQNGDKESEQMNGGSAFSYITSV